MMDEAVGESQSGKSCKQTQEVHNTSCPFDETVIYACGDNKDLSDLEDVGDLQQFAQSSLIESPDKIKCEEIYISSASSPEPDTVKCEEIYISSGSSPGFKDTDPAPSLFRRGQTFKREPESPPIPPPYGRQIRQHSPSMEISFKSLSSDSESPPRNPDKIEYHNNDKRLPIHSQPSSGLDSGNILRICFGEVSDDLICEIKPVSVRTNSVFVVDLNSVSLKSLYADDNGIWETSSPRRHYNVEMDAGRVSAISSSHKGILPTFLFDSMAATRHHLNENLYSTA